MTPLKITKTSYIKTGMHKIISRIDVLTLQQFLYTIYDIEILRNSKLVIIKLRPMSIMQNGKSESTHICAVTSRHLFLNKLRQFTSKR